MDAHVPDEFLVADLKVAGERHLVLATTTQLKLLAQARQWFADGTFEIINKPFLQLYSIHSFIKKDGELLQVPLAFILMTKRRSIDYKKARDIWYSIAFFPKCGDLN